MQSLAALQDQLRKNPGQDMRVVKAMVAARIRCLRNYRRLGITSATPAQPDSLTTHLAARCRTPLIPIANRLANLPPVRMLSKIAPMLLKKPSDTTLFHTYRTSQQPAFQKLITSRIQRTCSR